MWSTASLRLDALYEPRRAMCDCYRCACNTSNQGRPRHSAYSLWASRHVVLLFYRPGSTSVNNNFFTELSDVLDRLPTFVDPVVIAGDVNVRLNHVDESASPHVALTNSSRTTASHVAWLGRHMAACSMWRRPTGTACQHGHVSSITDLAHTAVQTTANLHDSYSASAAQPWHRQVTGRAAADNTVSTWCCMWHERWRLDAAVLLPCVYHS